MCTRKSKRNYKASPANRYAELVARMASALPHTPAALRLVAACKQSPRLEKLSRDCTTTVLLFGQTPVEVYCCNGGASSRLDTDYTTLSLVFTRTTWKAFAHTPKSFWMKLLYESGFNSRSNSCKTFALSISSTSSRLVFFFSQPSHQTASFAALSLSLSPSLLPLSAWRVSPATGLVISDMLRWTIRSSVLVRTATSVARADFCV